MSATVARRPRSFRHALREALAPPPHLRRRLLTSAALAALLIGGYLFWLRDSSLVKVETVTITGVTSDDAGRVRASLRDAARGMTTLHVDREKLKQATASFPAVLATEVEPDLPRGMRIHGD